MSPIRFIDLFAGCGGLSEGFVQAGFCPVSHVEMDQAACNTLRTRTAYHWLREHRQLSVYRSYLNKEISRSELYGRIPTAVLDTVIQSEIGPETMSQLFSQIDKLVGTESVDLIVGGPPCQAYSLVGRASDKKRMKGDKRNYLFRHYIQFLERYRPKFFVFENVIGFLSATDENGARYFDMMRDGFSSCGYCTEFQVLNAYDYGVPQARKRIILIGTRKDLPTVFPTIPRRRYKHIVNDMFAGLPTLHSGEAKPAFEANLPDRLKPALRSTGVLDETMPISQHATRPHCDLDLEIYRRVVSEWNENHRRLTYAELPSDLRTRTNLTSFKDRYKVVAGEQPCSHTVIAHIAKDGHYYIHPSLLQNRSLSIREAARLQTFPDNYYFESGSRNSELAAPYRQIGNAVPVLLSKKIAIALKKHFK